MKMIDLTNQKFGRLTVVLQDGVSGKKEAIWLCTCDCGVSICVTSSHLRYGHTRSCGCLQRESVVNRNITHGLSKMSGYDSWKAMRNRCDNKNNKYYRYYGGRGIKICKRWEKFENFYVDMGERPKGMSIDRVDNDKGYSKLNCRWVSRQDQQNNMRSNHRLLFKGRSRTIAQWSREIGIPYNTLFNRINTSKWSVDRALTEAINK